MVVGRDLNIYTLLIIEKDLLNVLLVILILGKLNVQNGVIFEGLCENQLCI